MSRDAIACLVVFKNVNEHGYHENVCLFAHLDCSIGANNMDDHANESLVFCQRMTIDDNDCRRMQLNA